MKTIHRDIVGAFIVSADGKLLLGYNKKGGVYAGKLVIPGGGIEEGEAQEEALAREVREETSIDISKARIELIGKSSGESEKFMKTLNETVWVKMTFYNFFVYLPETSDMVSLSFEDDFGPAQWYDRTELQNLAMSEPTWAELAGLGWVS